MCDQCFHNLKNGSEIKMMSAKHKLIRKTRFNVYACVYSAVNATVKEITVNCDEDAVLTCEAGMELGVTYRSLLWYKCNEDLPDSLTGIIRKKLKSNLTQKFNGFNRSVEVLDDGSNDLKINKATVEDSGKYKCSLSAPLGMQNKKGYIRLKVLGCPTHQTVTYLDAYCIVFSMIILVALVACFLSWKCLKTVLDGGLSVTKEQVKINMKNIQKKANLPLLQNTSLNGGEAQNPAGNTCQHHTCLLLP
ncbi:CD83 antigen-like isoform X1 [Acipenser ruthenus]|uniref:CD83 antigen-like isoform X1 n=1 Tax=Acipenser ruthenus TaxID=7906 RepID=UPI00274290FF|nr:CD83 antigen-like isoform X1 [Acipenser ruthenus]